MRSSSRRWLALAVGLLIVSGPVAAHHSSAVFDPNKRVTVTGIITEWFWANPHCLLSFDVKGADGQIVKWVAETQAPPNMIPYGWSRQSFKPGEEVAITMEHARSGKPVGRLLWAQWPDGRRLSIGPGAGAQP
jgi:hypothetical protein